MQTPIRATAAMVRALCFVASVIVFTSTSAWAQVNSWIKPTSGNWEEQTNWSLGILPNSSQSVYITNAGFKAVAIGTNASQSFPQSMQIQGLQIASPVDSFNELLMNFSGFTVPLQTTSIFVHTNSAIVLLSSSLVDSGYLFVGGSVSHGDFSQVKVAGALDIGRDGLGAYFLTNGTLSVGGLSMGAFQGPSGKFVQYGGVNNAGSIQVNNEGELDLYDGQVTATNGITVGGGDFANTASFYQYGGTVTGDTVVNGNYILNGGTITGHFTVAAAGQRPEFAYVSQAGGTNSASSMDLGHPNQFGGAASYTLSNGVVRVDSSTTFGGGSFSQYNGLHTIATNFIMHGSDVGLGTISADYLLAGGTLSVGGLMEEAAHFTQNGGTNLIAEALVLSLTPPNQSTSYSLSGGSLVVRDIEIDANAFFQHTSGQIAQSGLLLLDQGEWRAANGDYSLGPLQLGAPNTNAIGFHTNSAMIFPDGSSILRLANSSAQSWASNGVLYVTNWHGSASGGGQTQLYFGSDASGLTSQQLALIKFPLAGRLYPAQLLETGELVPQHFLTSSRSGNTLTMTWGPGSTLESSTNLAGPYQDVSGAASPYTLSTTNPVAFFRLRQ